MSELQRTARTASDGLHHCLVSLIASLEKHRLENEELKGRVAVLEERIENQEKVSSNKIRAQNQALHGDENASEIMKALQMTGPEGAIRKLRTDDEVRNLSRGVAEEVTRRVVLQLSKEAEVRVKRLGTELREETSRVEAEQNAKRTKMEESLVERMCSKKRFEASFAALEDEISRLKTELLSELAVVRKRLLRCENTIEEAESERTLIASMATSVSEKLGLHGVLTIEDGTNGAGQDTDSSGGAEEAKGVDGMKAKRATAGSPTLGGAIGSGRQNGSAIIINMLYDLAVRQQSAAVRVENAVRREDFDAFKSEAAANSKVKKISGELQRLKMEVLDSSNAISDLDQTVARHTDLHGSHSANLTQQKGSLRLLSSKAEEMVSKEFVEDVRRAILRDVDELRAKVLKGADARMVAKLLNTKADRIELRSILQVVGGLDDAAGSTSRCLSCNRPMVSYPASSALGAGEPLGPIARHGRPHSPPGKSMVQSQSQPMLRQTVLRGELKEEEGGEGRATFGRPQSAISTRRHLSPSREGDGRNRRPQTAGPSRTMMMAPVPFQPLVFGA